MIPYEKWHGAGNDFIIIDADANPVADQRAFGREVCDRETGVGADGVLFLALADSDPPRVAMTDVQPDGSIAAMCGNGARCAAKWASTRLATDELIIETPDGDRHATINGMNVTIEMGPYSFDPATIPLARDTPLLDEPVGDLTVTAVHTGVPHAVAFIDDIDTIDLAAIAPPIRHDPVFPEGANVTVGEKTSEGIRQRTFERGVEGETRACGTGAVALAAVTYRRDGRKGTESFTVEPPGGQLEIEIDEETAVLHGPVAKTGTGELPPASP